LPAFTPGIRPGGRLGKRTRPGDAPTPPKPDFTDDRPIKIHKLFSHIQNKGDKKMETTRKLNQTYETIAWGSLFIVWGITELFQSIPDGVAAIGIGLILIGLNVVRARNGLPTSTFSTMLGILALLLGGIKLAEPVLHISFEISVFAILLIVFGVSLITPHLTSGTKEQ
jgi:hypothetical protein